ncbi:MAG: hypothetical protein ABIH66_11170 [bacterium]
MANKQGESLKVGFNGSVKLEFHGPKVTSDAGLPAFGDFETDKAKSKVDMRDIG